MNIHELGELLRTERERRGMSQADVAQKTKISIFNIQAIEQGRRESLPHPVYAKGFVKNYARLLELDEAMLGKVMDKEYSVEEDDFGESPAMEKPVSMPAKAPGRKKSSLPIILLVIVLLAVLVGLMWYSRTGRQSVITEPEVQEEQVQAPETEMLAPEPEQESSQAPASETAPEAAEHAPEAMAPEEHAPASESAPEPEAEAPKPDAAKPEAVAPEPAPQAAPAVEHAPAAATEGGYSVTVTASELCWIYGTIDDGTITDFTLRPGQTHRIRFKESLILKLGNAGGVDVFFNGVKYEFEAVTGQVKTLTFP